MHIMRIIHYVLSIKLHKQIADKRYGTIGNLFYFYFLNLSIEFESIEFESLTRMMVKKGKACYVVFRQEGWQED